MNKKDIREEIKKCIIILDGAMGTMIQRYKLEEEDYRVGDFVKIKYNLKGCNDLLAIVKPQIIEDLHIQFLEAGADIISTNTFNSTSISMADYGLESYIKELNIAAAKIARKAADKFSTEDKPRFVAGSIGPTNKTASISPDVNNPAVRGVTYDELVEAYIEQIEALIIGGIDIILIETIFDTLNAKAALKAVDDVQQKLGTDLPVMVSVTVADSGGRTLSGQTISAFYNSLAHANIFSVGTNCSFGAEALKKYVKELSDVAECYVSAHPNAGLPNVMGNYDQTPEMMAANVKSYMDEKLVNIIGGCCGSTPEHIKAIAEVAKTAEMRPLPQLNTYSTFTGLESYEIRPESNFTNVGERCNVAGSRMFLRLINEKKYDEALEIARKQVENGAQIVDVNMDDAMLDAKAEMVTFLNLLMSEPEVARVPIMVDSSNWDVIETGLKCIQGKAIVNSISLKEGEDEFIAKAKKIKQYGAATVVMAFDENGQADTYERKIEICERAYRILTEKVGFNPKDIIFDPNVLAIATGIEEHNNYAVDFIKTVTWIKANLPHALISGGISNLSFSFRGNNVVREAMHSVFLYHAIREGMDMGIVNPAMLQVYDDIPKDLLSYVEDVVLNKRPDATERMVEFAEKVKGEVVHKVENKQDEWRNSSLEERFAYALRKGISSFMKEDLDEALKTYPTALSIIEQPLMAGMNKVGELFGDGKMFLPQVVKTARVMKEAVAILQPIIEKEKNGESKSAGKILMATVKGDVHDIGKNIVSVILACNNYEVIDLGVMVPTDTIVQAAIDNNVDIIGLSGLITPSLEEMVAVATEMQKRGLSIPLMVGGATTSKIHTAVKIAPVYDYEVIHVKDASLSAAIVSELVNKEKRQTFRLKLFGEYEELRNKYFTQNLELVSLDEARSNKVKIDFKAENIIKPQFEGTRKIDFSVSELRPYIDWRFFFYSWKLSGNYEGINQFDCEGCKQTWLAKYQGLELEKAKEALQLFTDANVLLNKLEKEISVSGLVAFHKANSQGDDLLIGDKTFPFLRQQVKRDGEYACLADFVAPKESGIQDYIGTFAVTVGTKVEEMISCFEKNGDDYNALLLKSVADRLAEAAAELLHANVRKSYWGFSQNENVSIAEALKAKYRSIRPAVGYPSIPNQADIFLLNDLMDLSQIDITLTESGAMYPNASVSGLFFAHPEARYFAVQKIGEDQLADYAERKNMTTNELRKWIRL